MRHKYVGASGPTYHRAERSVSGEKERKREEGREREREKEREGDARIGFQSKLINMRLVIPPSLFSTA